MEKHERIFVPTMIADMANYHELHRYVDYQWKDRMYVVERTNVIVGTPEELKQLIEPYQKEIERLKAKLAGYEVNKTEISSKGE